MARPEKDRIVHKPPLFSEFKPVGIPSNALTEVLLTLDEYEAFRLADHLGMSQLEAAEEMEVSRPTFTRLIEKARKKIADFIVQGKVLSIQGGNIHFRRNIIKCLDCGHMFQMNMDDSFSDCPDCGSKNLMNLAGGFGHGQCCANRGGGNGGNGGRRGHHGGRQ
ncbi:DUF134 domain-containing protein [Ancylomarina sp. 16SWW S1-10-2]|uniref:DUF134 domain-containing protein n=1 Tax=Ancylomarina sp. 16SWW S1-10-2 TaxID=2499681 RepID=UPI0012ADF993|nr:DUF134 domain-containing protein [Ancylomarina sp. 16SWW S1-10-2]MRT93626.1 DUF134 domain-containing protein [Ancylomarina sp. 16SWW S1-10-2]